VKEWAFPNSEGKMHVPRARVFKEIYRRVVDGSEVEPYHPDRRLTYHDLRHTFASLWMQNRGDLFKLQRILGHKDINMTLRYSHLAPEAYRVWFPL
jgi:integrase